MQDEISQTQQWNKAVTELWDRENKILHEIKTLLKETHFKLKTIHALWGDVWYQVAAKSIIPDFLYQIPFLATEYPEDYDRRFMEFGIFHAQYVKEVKVKTTLHRKQRNMPEEVYEIARKIQQILAENPMEVSRIGSYYTCKRP